VTTLPIAPARLRWELPNAYAAVPLARRLLEQGLANGPARSLLPTVRVVVSELVGCAVGCRTAVPMLRLDVEVADAFVRAELSPGPATLAHPARGRAARVVDRLCDYWGTLDRDGLLVVWCTVSRNRMFPIV
jgi:hypothetical protein